MTTATINPNACPTTFDDALQQMTWYASFSTERRKLVLAELRRRMRDGTAEQKAKFSWRDQKVLNHYSTDYNDKALLRLEQATR